MRKKDTRKRRPIAGATIAIVVWLLLFWDVDGWVSRPVAVGRIKNLGEGKNTTLDYPSDNHHKTKMNENNVVIADNYKR